MSIVIASGLNGNTGNIIIEDKEGGIIVIATMEVTTLPQCIRKYKKKSCIGIYILGYIIPIFTSNIDGLVG